MKENNAPIGEFKRIVLNDLHRPEWLFEGLLQFIEENEGVDEVEVCKKFKMRVDILANALITLRQEGKIERGLNEKYIATYKIVKINKE